jgi:hypothetical protein
MNKPTIIISSPVDTYSGYGARSRDFIKAVIALDKYNVKLLSQRWGNTRFGYLEDHKEDTLYSLIIPKIDIKPEIWVQITVPNEFQPVGKYNIGVTAGIEATIVDQSWIQGVNRMDLTLTSSAHSKEIFTKTTWEVKDNKTGQITSKVQVSKPIEVLLEGADLTKYFKTTSNIDLSSIPESFCFLCVGHWLKGEYGHDRKDIGYTIKSFFETFKNKPNQPALILKTSHATTSIMDKSSLLKKIESIRRTSKGKLPNVYVIHGDLSDSEINEMYNHSKVKAMVSLTRGEGFGRPLLEFSLIGKPIIASGWSGHIDFLDKEYTTLLNGKLEQLHPSSVQKGVLLAQASWFKADAIEVGKAYKNIFKHYKKYVTYAKKLAFQNKTTFSFDNMVVKLDTLFKQYIPEFAQQVQLKLPKLKKVGASTPPAIKLPKLKKV